MELDPCLGIRFEEFQIVFKVSSIMGNPVLSIHGSVHFSKKSFYRRLKMFIVH